MTRSTDNTSWLDLLGEDRADLGAAILRFSHLAVASHQAQARAIHPEANGLADRADGVLVNVAKRDASTHTEVRR